MRRRTRKRRTRRHRPRAILRATALAVLWGMVVFPPTAYSLETGSASSNAPRWANTTPWTAAEHLGSQSGGLAGGGWWLELGSVTREAVDEEREGSLRGGFTRPALPGVQFGWRWTGGGGSTPTHDRELRLVLPWTHGRADAGVRLVQRGARRVWSVPVRVLIRAGSFLVGSRIALYPGPDAGSADAVLVAAAGRERWLGVLELGPGPGGTRASLGLRITDDILWLVHVADLDPSTGVHVRFGRFEIRAETTPHRVLGTTTRVCLVWSGGAT